MSFLASVNWENAETDLVYNTLSQHPEALVTGILHGDSYELTYAGANISANRNSLGLLTGKSVYTASVTGITNGDYIDYVIDSENNPTCDYYINQYKLNVKAKPVSIIFGDNVKNEGYTIDDALGLDVIDTSVIDYDYTYSRYADIGNYLITPKGLTHDNYEFIYIENIFKHKKTFNNSFISLFINYLKIEMKTYFHTPFGLQR